jgi:hypothetical protein
MCQQSDVSESMFFPLCLRGVWSDNYGTFAVVIGERFSSSVQYLYLTLAVRETSEWRCPTASGSSQSLLGLPQQGQVRAR